MERKRKLPPRAAARGEHSSKKGKTETPSDHHRSATPATATAPNDALVPGDGDEPQKPPPPPLPTAVQPGKPLPTIEDAQADDLPTKDFQSVQESGVLAESLSRSRQKWISDGLFEKYWTKPTKKKGVVQEDAKNPPKDSMAKVGQVTIYLQPHFIDATMYAVKDANKPAPQPVFRPILQYGPPNGAMPPPPTPSTKPPSPAIAAAPSQPPNAIQPAPGNAPSPSPVPAPAPAPSAISSPAPPPAQQDLPQAPAAAATLAQPQPQPSSAPQDAPRPVPTSVAAPPKPVVASPRGLESVLSPSTAPAPPPPRPSNMSSQPLAPQIQKPSPSPSTSAASPSFAAPAPNRPPAPIASAPTPPQGAARAAPPANRPAQPVPGTDPIIVTLAEKANEDPQLRDLMKRVANGNAPKDELARFQAIIDQITAESKKKGGSQGPSADRLFVDGKSVRYFADEVDTIVSIVLRTNPRQTSANLSPPPKSNALVVELVKASLDDPKTLERVRRIAKGNTEFSDATDLKETLDRLKDQLAQQNTKPSVAPSKVNGTPNGSSSTAPQQSTSAPAPQQALRSKGPPPAVKPDVSAVVLEFAGGNGDRYLFPKFSIVEQITTPQGPQLIASFLIVRKGSASEYGGDPKLDYYQPVTVRITSTQPRHLDYFRRVVAPPDEVMRYMDDIMDNMTRAEYVLLAMRLPRPEKEAKEDGVASEKENAAEQSNTATPEADDRDVWRKGLTWKKDKAMRQLSAKSTPLKNAGNGKAVSEDDQYQNFISSVSRKETEGEE